MKQPPESPAVATARHAAPPAADLHPQPTPENALVAEPAPSTALVSQPEADPPRDAHGFDPAAYRWVPVLRKPRKDGWTPQRQLEFIRLLADTGCVEQAAREAGMSVASCYRLRREAPQFAAAWEAAIAHAARRLVDLAFDRAIHGSDEPVFDKDGNQIGRRMRQNDRLLMFLLRAYMPERFRHAHRDMQGAGETPPPRPEPLAEALVQLQPVAPPEPHKLMPPEELEAERQCADLLDGRLAHWHRGRGDAEPALHHGLGPEFERALAEAKRAAARRPGPDGDDGV